MKKTKYQQLKDFDWLKENYINLKRSTKSIAQELNCNANSVRQALLYHKFDIRNRSEAQCVHHKELNIDEELITASLLGDGALEKSNHRSIESIPLFYKKNKYKSHLNIVARSFYNNFEDYIKEEEHYYKYKGEKYSSKIFVFRTFVSKKLVQFYENWYGNNTKKYIIPPDIPISPKVLLHWFLDDGSCSYRNRKEIKNPKKKSATLIFCTESFNKNDQQILTDRINKEYNLRAKLTPIKNSFRIKIPTIKINDFFDIIGECPIDELQYKWKRPCVMN